MSVFHGFFRYYISRFVELIIQNCQIQVKTFQHIFAKLFGHPFPKTVLYCYFHFVIAYIFLAFGAVSAYNESKFNTGRLPPHG